MSETFKALTDDEARDLLNEGIKRISFDDVLTLFELHDCTDVYVHMVVLDDSGRFNEHKDWLE